MDGAPGGNTGTGTVEIKVLDLNDNVPTLEKDEVINKSLLQILLLIAPNKIFDPCCVFSTQEILMKV